MIGKISRETALKYCLNIFICILANITIGLGVAIVRLTVFGNDPFNASCLAVSSFFNIRYTTYTLCYNCFLFVFEILFGRKHIGPGTFINWFLCCIAVDFFYGLFIRVYPSDPGLLLRIALLILGLLVCSFGLAVYQECAAGVAPYDAIPLIVTERFPKIKFFAARITLDSLGVLTAILFHGVVGVGTILSAFGLGPLIHIYHNIFTAIKKKRAARGQSPV